MSGKLVKLLKSCSELDSDRIESDLQNGKHSKGKAFMQFEDLEV